jgi:hypothetical protein
MKQLMGPAARKPLVLSLAASVASKTLAPPSFIRHLREFVIYEPYFKRLLATLLNRMDGVNDDEKRQPGV